MSRVLVISNDRSALAASCDSVRRQSDVKRVPEITGRHSSRPRVPQLKPYHFSREPNPTRRLHASTGSAG